MLKLEFPQTEFSEISEKILSDTEKTLGFVPNMYRTFANNTSLLDAYTHSYNTFRKNAGFNAVEQEVILLSISYFNECEYCMSAHSFIAEKMSKLPASVLNALRTGEEIEDNRLNALSQTTKLLVENRGHLTNEELENFFDAGYSPSALLGIITGIAVKTMSNYSNHNTSPELDVAFENHGWKKD